MDLDAIDMPALADLLDEATIHTRIDSGPIMTMIGTHPERGPFTVVQSFAGAWLIAERDAYLAGTEINSMMVADAMQVLRDASRRAGGFTFKA